LAFSGYKAREDERARKVEGEKRAEPRRLRKEKKHRK